MFEKLFKNPSKYRKLLKKSKLACQILKLTIISNTL